MKLLRSNRGFTLMEVLIAVGLTSVMLTIIMQTQSVSEKTTADLQLHTEINALIQKITTEFSRPSVCTYNLKYYSAPTDGPFAPDPPLPMPKLMALNGKPFLETGNVVTDVNHLRKNNIQSIDSITYVGNATTKSADIKVYFTPHGKASQFFTVTLNVYPGADPTKVETCYFDEKSALISAVKAACVGDGATYNAAVGTYGTCEHVVKVVNSSAGNETTLACPPGEFLAKVDAPTYPPTYGQRTFTCQKVSTTGTICGNWEYMEGINADGSAKCVNILSYFGAGTGLIKNNNNTYQVVNLDCGNTGLILTNYGGTFNCVDPKRSGNCPLGQVLYGIDSSGNLLCKPYPDVNACGAGSYMISVDSSGVVACGAPTLTNSCTNPYVVNGTTTGGAVTCTLNPY